MSTSFILQILAGGFYLLNKILLSASERMRRSAGGDGRDPRVQRLIRWAWTASILGLFPWVLIFIEERNWIAASVETSGLPSMALGIFIASRGGDIKSAPAWLDRLAMLCIPLGFIYSLYDFGGFGALSQWLETGLVLGFLVGTYQLAKQNPQGYLWYVAMHLLCGYLMWLQEYPWLALQQAVSLLFVGDAYYTRFRLDAVAASRST
jgi:hypothetical protein